MLPMSPINPAIMPDYHTVVTPLLTPLVMTHSLVDPQLNVMCMTSQFLMLVLSTWHYQLPKKNKNKNKNKNIFGNILWLCPVPINLLYDHIVLRYDIPKLTLLNLVQKDDLLSHNHVMLCSPLQLIILKLNHCHSLYLYENYHQGTIKDFSSLYQGQRINLNNFICFATTWGLYGTVW